MIFLVYLRLSDLLLEDYIRKVLGGREYRLNVYEQER